jgi:transposase InsO family protein
VAEAFVHTIKRDYVRVSPRPDAETVMRQLVNRLPVTIASLSDNGSCYVAGGTRSFARDIGLEPRTTPIM